jgi:hypothetical protein
VAEGHNDWRQAPERTRQFAATLGKFIAAVLRAKNSFSARRE